MEQKTKTLLLIAVLAVLLFAASFLYPKLSQQYAEAVPVPESEPVKADAAEPAPDFYVQNGSGEIVHLSDFLGEPVVINFWASWCGPCKSEMPAFQKAYDTYGESVAFLMINATDGQRETVATARTYIDGAGYTFPVYFDTTQRAMGTYGVTAFPTTVFIDAEGGLAGEQIGAITEATLFAKLEALTAVH